MNDIGIMQGRLLPVYEGRFQAFPATNWRDEFHLGAQAGLARIEWIYEVPHEADNPLANDDGIAEMLRLADETGVRVRSICADYYMVRHLIGADDARDAEVVAHLRWLIGRAAKLGVVYMVLPFVDASSLKSEGARNELVALLRDLAPEAQAAGVELHLETDLSPAVFSDLLLRVGHPMIKANFDIGNSASLGWDPTEELTALAPWLGSVHVKDRVLGGGTVTLGTGNADFPTVFRLIAKAGFSGTFILQAARDGNLSEVELARRNIAFVRSHLTTLGA